MSCKNKNLIKVASILLIGAFSFGLSISCVNAHKKETIKVSAEESDGTWTLTDGSLKFQYTDWQSNGYVTQTNQTMVHGNGDGTFDIGYELLGDPPGATTASTVTLAEKTIQLTGGYWTPSETGGYGTVSGYPVDVNGLDSGVMITLNINVQYSGDMNEQNSGTGTTEPDGTWTLTDGSLKFQYTDWQSNGYVTQTNQTMVHGNGDGTFDIGYELLGDPPGATTASTQTLAEKTIQLTGGYWTRSETGGYGTVSGFPVNVNGLDSGTMITLNITVQYSGDMNEQGSGGGEDENTVVYYDASVGFYYGTTERVVLTVTSVDFTGSDNFDNGTATVHLTNDDVQYFATMSNVSLNPVPTSPSGESYTGEITGYIDESQCSVNYYPLESVPLNYEVEGTPEPPALSALEWYFDTDMGYFATNLYNDNYYSFALSTQINSVIYDRENFTVTAHCTVDVREGNMPEEYYEAEITFAYTFESSGLVENDYHFYNAVCEDTVEDKEEIYFSVDVVSFRQIGWYFDEDLRYYVEEGVEASWNILHAEYRTEDSRNELILYMQILYDNEYTDDVIQINNPDFDDAPYRGQTTLGTGVSGWSDKLQQRISLDINYVPFGYYANGWSYDPYFNQLVYINADDIDMKYQLTSASSNEGSYLLTYTCDGDSQSITVMEAVYEDEMLTGEVVLVENSDPITVSVSVPQSIIDGGTTSTYEFHISFDGNGATSGRMSDVSFTSPDYSVDYELPECSFEREDYVFFAWSLSDDGLITNIKPHETRNISYSEDGITFYAIWGRTISFDSNGGDGYMEPLVVKEGYNEVPSCGFSRDGYAFKCWAVGSPTGVEINAGSRVNVDGNYVLYAIWEQTGPVQHEGMWYDEELHKLRFYNTDLAEEQEVQLEAKVLDFGPNTAETRAELVAHVLDKGELWGDFAYDMRSFSVGVENSKKFISGEIDVDYDQRYEQVKLYPEIFYNNVFKPGQLNYAEGYNQIFYVNDSYESAVVEPEVVEFNEITRVFRIEAYAEDVTGEEDLIEFTFELTDGVVLEGDLTQDAQLIEGYLENVGRRVKLNVFDIQYNSLEEEAITPETIEDITNAMDTVELSPDQINQINQKIEDNKEQIPDSTGGKIADALANTAPTLSDDPEVLGAQKDVIVAVVETVIEVETNRPSDIGQSIRTDSSLPANAGISIEQEVREFYELQMANLIGEEKANRRAILRAPTATDYKIDVSGKTKEELEKDLNDYGTMTEFINDSVQNMNTAGRKLRSCSGEAMKVEVKRTVVKIKTSSFRDFDKEAADLQFAYDVHNAMMLHLQEVVVTELEKDYKPSGNKEKDEQYQQELAACKDIESFTEIVIEVLRQKYNAIMDSNVEYDDFVQISDDGKYSGIYWDIFEAWCLDKPCPYPITFQELTDATVDTTTQNARSFELNTEVTNTEVVFTAAFVGGGVAFISLAGVLGYVLKKRSLKGVSK